RDGHRDGAHAERPGARAAGDPAAARRGAGGEGDDHAHLSPGGVHAASTVHTHSRARGAPDPADVPGEITAMDRTTKWLLGSGAALALLVGIVAYFTLTGSARAGRATSMVVVAR